jgi:hypothetical protein
MAGEDQKTGKKDPLEEHDVVKRLVKETRSPSETTMFMGYVGKSDSNDTYRLYLNLDFTEFIDIPKKSIRNAVGVSESIIPFGGTCIWVEKTAVLKYVHIESTSQQAEFLKGDIYNRYVRRSLYGATGPSYSAVPSLGNCPTIYGCSQWPECSRSGPCTTLVGPKCLLSE